MKAGTFTAEATGFASDSTSLNKVSAGIGDGIHAHSYSKLYDGRQSRGNLTVFSHMRVSQAQRHTLPE